MFCEKNRPTGREEKKVTHDNTVILKQSRNMVNNEQAALLTPTNNVSCLTQGLSDGVKPRGFTDQPCCLTEPSVCLPSNIIQHQLLNPHSAANQNTIIQYHAGAHLHIWEFLQLYTLRKKVQKQSLGWYPKVQKLYHHHPIPKKSKITGIHDYRPVVMKSFGKTGAGPPEGPYWTLAGSSSVCLQCKQVCGRCSLHGTALCSATSRQTRDFHEDPVCGLQFGL